MWYMTHDVLKKKDERLLPFYVTCELGCARGIVELERHAVDGRTVTVVRKSLLTVLEQSILHLCWLLC